MLHKPRVNLPRGTLPLIAVTIAALLDLRVSLRSNRLEIPDSAMRAAVQKLDALTKPGDVLLHSPLFAVRDLAPLGDRPASPSLPTPALRKSRRVLVLDRRDYTMQGLGRPTTTVPVTTSDGLDTGLEIAIHEPEGAFDLVVYQLQESILPGVVRVERPLGTVTSRCNERRPEGGYSCPGEPEWLYAALRNLTIDNQDSACVWAHPTTGGAIIFELPGQKPPPPGRSLVLRLGVGLADDAVRTTPDGAFVSTDVVQGGQSRGNVTIANRIGWQRATLAIEPGVPTELRITTPRDGRRHHCITAEIVELESASAKPGGTP